MKRYQIQHRNGDVFKSTVTTWSGFGLHMTSCEGACNHVSSQCARTWLPLKCLTRSLLSDSLDDKSGNCLVFLPFFGVAYLAQHCFGFQDWNFMFIACNHMEFHALCFDTHKLHLLPHMQLDYCCINCNYSRTALLISCTNT